MGTLYGSFCLRLLADNLKKRAKKKLEKTTEWTLGQPLVFPTKLKSNEAKRVELVDPAIGEPLKNPVGGRMGVDDTIPSPIALPFLSQ